MGIVQSYTSVSRFFRLWVYAMEFHTRRAQISEATPAGGHVLIISPPTDPAIRLIAQSNETRETTLVCFSDSLEQRAIVRSKKWGGSRLHTRVVPFFQLPFPDSTIRTVFANCFFDFCSTEELQPVFSELSRVLEPGGILHSVYMAPAKSRLNRVWTWAFKVFPHLSCGCRAVSIGPHLSNAAFLVLQDRAMNRLGFPVQYTVAQRLEGVA